VLAFFLLIGFVFWLASLHDKKDWAAAGTASADAPAAHGSGGRH
jgi:hypothetical protein